MNGPDIRREGAVLYLEGAVTFASAGHLLAVLEGFIAAFADESGVPGAGGQRPPLTLDCGAMVNRDSAALALLMAATRAAAAKEVSLGIIGLGDQLTSLSHLYGIAPLLGVSPVD